MTPIRFGTDGWRAVIAEDFTFANIDRVAQATADYWKANPQPGTELTAIVGYDRRFLSDQFARRTAEVLAREWVARHHDLGADSHARRLARGQSGEGHRRRYDYGQS